MKKAYFQPEIEVMSLITTTLMQSGASEMGLFGEEAAVQW